VREKLPDLCQRMIGGHKLSSEELQTLRRVVSTAIAEKANDSRDRSGM
jgi:hypothetical protein